MGLGVGLILAAVGAVLAFAVNTTVNGVDIHTIGWILLIVGHRRNPAVTDLLVLVGRPRLLQPPPDVLRRGPRRTGRRRALLDAEHVLIGHGR